MTRGSAVVTVPFGHMALETLFNLPAHPLLVHVPVVCIPMAAVGAVAVACRPQWRKTYGLLVVALAFVGMIGAQLAIMSGEALQESRHIRDLGDHGDYGELARTMSISLFGFVVVLYALDRWGTDRRLRRVPAWAATAVAMLTVVSAAGALGTAVIAGHTGAERVWKDKTVVETAPR
jgi:uncharacterized membrane protein